MSGVRDSVRTCVTMALLVVAAGVCAPWLAAQEGAAAPRPLKLEDYGAWSRITQVQISPDGRWMTYAYQPNDGDARFHVRELDGDRVHEAVNGTGAAFSIDGRRVAFLTTPPESETRGGAGENRSSRTPPRRTLHLLDLSGDPLGEPETYEGVRGFGFSETGRFLAVHRDRASTEAEHQGSDLIVHDLESGVRTALGNVAAFAFNEPGTHLAYLVDAADQVGNGLYVLMPGDGRLRTLDAADERYEGLAWDEAGSRVATLRGAVPEGQVHRVNRVVVATGLDGALDAARVRVVEASAAAGVGEDLVVSEQAGLRWTDDGARLVLGLDRQEDKLERDDDEERPNVEVWHWRDERLQSQQRVQAGADRRFTYTTVLDPEAGRFVQLATDAMPRVEILGQGTRAMGRDDSAYRGDVTQAGGRTDYVRLDVATGEATPVARAVRRTVGTSPDGRWFVYVQDERVMATDLATMRSTDLTAATGVDFINREFDQVAERPAYGLGGWTDDGRVLLYGRYDIWAVPLEGGEAEPVTGGAGARDEIRYRVLALDPDADHVDPDGALLTAYGEWTKRSGYVRARPGRDPEVLLYGDEMTGSVRKADEADRLVFTRQTFERFPDYWVSDTGFRSPRRITDANPQISEHLWGRRVLVDYTDDRGNRLQATLALPAGYEEGRRYPMLVYFYEKMSQRHHEFSLPVYDDRPHMSTYASNGYLVLMPDIVYDDGLPGMSALDDVTAATERVIELGYADPERIGLQGHSWGGYQSSFIVTQTDLFAAVVTGAPLTNLISMYNINYKSTGSGNGPILEWSQGRLGVSPWENFDLYVSQSPVHQAEGIETPFLILHGTADGAVDWNQGLEFFNAARRLGKEVILLSYPDEPHHLAREPNQKDFQIRMRQYFDHYLKGEPAPAWMLEGLPHLEHARITAPGGG
jgi:dipeptidyl aminopeptidase/acylaminoacyl peptidase